MMEEFSHELTIPLHKKSDLRLKLVCNTVHTSFKFELWPSKFCRTCSPSLANGFVVEFSQSKKSCMLLKVAQ